MKGWRLRQKVSNPIRVWGGLSGSKNTLRVATFIDPKEDKDVLEGMFEKTKEVTQATNQQ